MKYLIILFAIFLYAKKSEIFICATTTSWAPFNTLQNHKLVGISVDFLKLIEKKAHIKSKCKIYNSWNDVLNAIKTKKADLSLGTDKTPQKEKFAIFTKPYATFPITIATKNNVGYIASIIFLKNKTIAVGKNYTVEHLLKKYYPSYKIISVKDTKTALKLVSEGKAFAAIDIMPVLVYNINKYQFANLKIAGKTPWEFKMRFILSKNNIKLKNILNQSIDKITEEEKNRIYEKWIHVTYQKGFSLKEVLIFFSTFTVFTIILLIWISKLKKELKRKTQQEKILKKLSLIDSLTGTFNRYKTEVSLKQQIAFAKRHQIPLSIIFFDIDHFKKINDTYGHMVGDKVLKGISDLMKNNIREYDIFGRWGGEEFIIILPNTTLEEAREVASKLKTLIENYHFLDTQVTCSFGVTILRKNDNIDTLIKRADEFMYQAKKEGRNRIIYT
ncbi:MAG: diguanylate cyclase [Nautiliaceae bacterium]